MKTTTQIQDIHENIPTLILRNTVIFPGVTMPVLVARKRGINAINEALQKDKLVFAVAQKKDDSEANDLTHLYSTGTICVINKVEENDRGDKVVSLTALQRARSVEYSIIDNPEYVSAKTESESDLVDLDAATETALLKNLREISYDILDLIKANEEFKRLLNTIDNVGKFTNIATQQLPIILTKKQEILETTSLKNRSLKVLELLVDQRELMKVNSEVGTLISNKTSKAYRESILREQLKVIKEELGENESAEEESLKDKILKAKMPEEVEKVALQQAKRLESMGPQNAESHVLRNYIELLLELPWSKAEATDINILEAEKILNRDHYGLEKVKKNILRFLSVLKLNKNKKGSILLLVGPPGVGKTSLGQSIAESLKRNYIRISLGGVRDESEIRGHRRTYVGAMPGKIIDAIKKAKTNNPVFILDEIDKMGQSYQGDPGAALLEVLDPEQNATFRDHYLDVPYDLSNVFFVATANSLEGIPAPLLDRMEVIQLGSYTSQEKLQIAKNHIVPNVFKEHGVTEFQDRVLIEHLNKIIHEYTREAGVRDLKRKIGTVASYLAEKVVKNETIDKLSLTDIESALGHKKINYDKVLDKSVPGVVTGLAWTPVGGDILFIETVMMPGTGKILLTGKLGDVMSESAQIALSLVRSKLSPYLSSVDFNKRDFHLHVPSGAIPKDGPSAGITMFTALSSLLLNQAIDKDIAMTGEVSLRGAVLPVGGIKEKVIAAHRSGVKRIILSKQNESDLVDVPDEVKREIRFDFVEDINDLLGILFNRRQHLLTSMSPEIAACN